MPSSLRILSLLSEREKLRGFLLLILVIVMGVIDALGVASVFPLLSLLSNASINSSLGIFSSLTSLLGIQNQSQFVTVLVTVSLGVLVLGLVLKGFVTFLQIRFALGCQTSLASRLVNLYLSQPYAWFLNQNSADLGKNILAEVGVVIGSGLMPLMTVVTQGVVAISLVTLLVVIDYQAALAVGLFLVIIYVAMFAGFKNILADIGRRRLSSNKEMYTATFEAFGGIKEVKLSRLEKVYLGKFENSARECFMHTGTAQIIGQMPRFVVEGLIVVALMGSTVFFVWGGRDFVEKIPIIGVYAFAGYRLMPAVQQIFNALAQMRYAGASIERFLLESSQIQAEDLSAVAARTDGFSGDIRFRDVFYQYPGANRWALRDINLLIPENSSFGIVGVSGGGKTTLVDLLTGLLAPNAGEVTVGGQRLLASSAVTWQASVGYVPQQIFLIDDTIKANIALGVEEDCHDNERIQSAAKKAGLHEFIMDELPLNYQTRVGERGVRLSGGQRQRIGIARALYRNPKVIIFDEATSALDGSTEEAVMHSIQAVGGSATVILIAHRLTTLRYCDAIAVISDGAVEGVGSFEELARDNATFQKLLGSQTRQLGNIEVEQ